MRRGEVVGANPTAADLAVKEPIAIRHTEAGSQGRDPSIVPVTWMAPTVGMLTIPVLLLFPAQSKSASIHAAQVKQPT
jgi:hypothetical protein